MLLFAVQQVKQEAELRNYVHIIFSQRQLLRKLRVLFAHPHDVKI